MALIPLLIFLLACAGVYLGAIEAAFSALMRLSLRLLAERSGRPDRLGEYLDDPVLLFLPVRLLLGLVTAMATALSGACPRTAASFLQPNRAAPCTDDTVDDSICEQETGAQSRRKRRGSERGGDRVPGYR
jgi:hypothetical protein